MLKDEVNTIFFQLREEPLLQHVKVGSSCHSGFSEEGPINLSMRNGTEDIEFGGITFVFQDCVRIFTPCGVTSRIVCLYPHLQTRWLTCMRASQLPSQKLTPTCYREFGKNLITGLMCAVLRVERILNICNMSEKTL
jgi:hypothetical protein